MLRHQPLLPAFWGTAASPVEQQVQHLLGSGEGPVSAQEDGDIGGIVALKAETRYSTSFSKVPAFIVRTLHVS